MIAGLLLLTAFFALAAILAVRWPFKQSAVVAALEKAGSGKIEIRNFRQTFFPYPGCVAEGVIYRLTPTAPPIATIDRLTIDSNYVELPAKHIRLMRAAGLHVFVPPGESRQKFKGLSPGSTRIDRISIEQAIFEVSRKQAPALQFGIHQLTLDTSVLTGPVRFSATLFNPEPPGEIAVSGKFGPWQGKQTPISGNYKFENADLGVFHGISGLLSSTGTFNGPLQHIDVSGEIQIPAFALKRTQHAVPLNSQFSAYVNGVNGDTFLTLVNSRLLQTDVASSGSIAGSPGRKGKTATMDLETRDGRIQDILWLFVQSSRPPMSGVVSFIGKATLPPGPERFLKKLELEGDFGVRDSRFTRQVTQQKVDRLSQKAQMDELPDQARKKEKNADSEKGNTDRNADADNGLAVLSDLAAHVILKSGIATFSNLSFYIPGAHARMHGTYNLISDKVDLHGMFKMDSELSHATQGPKAALLKVLSPFFKRKSHRGSEVPVKITGTYRHPSVGVDVAAAGGHILK